MVRDRRRGGPPDPSPRLANGGSPPPDSRATSGRPHPRRRAGPPAPGRREHPDPRAATPRRCAPPRAAAVRGRRVEGEVGELTAALAAAVVARTAAEQRYAEERPPPARRPRRGRPREGVARLAGRAGAALPDRGRGEVGRLRQIAAAALARAAAAEQEFARLEGSIADHEVGEADLDAVYERADKQLTAATAGCRRHLREAERATERETQHQRGPARGPEPEPVGKDGSPSSSRPPQGRRRRGGLMVQVDAGFEPAIAAASAGPPRPSSSSRSRTRPRRWPGCGSEQSGTVGLLVGESAPTADRAGLVGAAPRRPVGRRRHHRDPAVRGRRGSAEPRRHR